MTKSTNPFRSFDSSPEVSRPVVLVYVKHQLSLRNVEDLPAERGIDICHETVRLWWNRSDPLFATDNRLKRVDQMRAYPHCLGSGRGLRPINGEMHYPWRAVDRED